MKLYNTLTRKVDTLESRDDNNIRMYSCGPTVYDHAHIGNLSAYIFADTLRRVVSLCGYNVIHAMNYTDVDDKTIRRSQEKYPGLEPRAALKKLTAEYIDIFLSDMHKIGNDVDALHFMHATDPEIIKGMQDLIARLHAGGFAYVADDGVYFSIDAYRKSGKTYGQLLKLTLENTGEERIQNDEYDKASAHDFALWKRQKPGEPAWDFTLEGHDLTGRPGWHIECSVMSRHALGQPFDIHTGGIDLIFPHHENEIAQSTACEADPVMASVFAHNEHILVDGKKMAKSAHNFYTLQDIIDRGYDPLAFRLLVLQSHYRSQVHFSWENLEAAQNRLRELRTMADLRWQVVAEPSRITRYGSYLTAFTKCLQDDLDTPSALAIVSGAMDDPDAVSPETQHELIESLRLLDKALGLRLLESTDITDEQESAIQLRREAREQKDWAKADELRDKLVEQGIGLRDTPNGGIWYRL